VSNLPSLLDEYGSLEALNRAVTLAVLRDSRTLKEASMRLGVNPATLWKWRTGSGLPTRHYRRQSTMKRNPA
jgi:transposase-like protein